MPGLTIMPRGVSSNKEKTSKGDELTLRLDGALVAPDEFRKAINAFVELLLQVSEEIAQGGKQPKWNMSVRKGSSILVAKPVPDASTQRQARETIKSVKSGIAKLERGQYDDVPHFNSRALQAAGALASIRAKPDRIGVTTVEIASNTGKPCPVTPKTAESVSKTVGAQHQAFGSVEGKLQTISDRGNFQFVVWDALSDRPINCFVPENKFQDAYAAFRSRVAVSGMIQYDREGRPVSIRVESIRVFRELADMPPIEHFCGILKGA